MQSSLAAVTFYRVLMKITGWKKWYVIYKKNTDKTCEKHKNGCKRQCNYAT